MLKLILYAVVSFIARMHDKILELNDAYEYNFSDKELHFLVIGIIGMAMLFGIHMLFSFLARHGHILVISWLYVLTLIIVLAFAIEIGQRTTGTGTMQFADIVAGIGGFLIMFLVFAVIRFIALKIYKAVGGNKKKEA